MKKIFNILLAGVCILASHGCSDKDFPVPPASTVPKFSFTGDSDFAPVTIAFKNESIVPARAGTVSYIWNFDDGTSSTEENPSHFYKLAGVYTVNLVVISTTSNEINESSIAVVVKDPNEKGTPMYFTDGSVVYSGIINDKPPVMASIGISTLQDSYGMAFDTVNNKLYIADFDGSKIYTADPDGNNLTTFRAGIGQPDGIAIDYENHMIYWDTSNGIRRADMTNTNVGQFEDFVTGQGNDPEGLAIDGVNKTLYWNNYDGNVWVKNLDGSGEKSIITSGGGGSVIVINDHIYFDDYVDTGDIRLKYANLDGSSVATIATNISKVVYGLAYDKDNAKIYWVDRNVGTIMRSDLNGENTEPWYVNDGVNPRGIVIGKKKI